MFRRGMFLSSLPCRVTMLKFSVVGRLTVLLNGLPNNVDILVTPLICFFNCDNKLV